MKRFNWLMVILLMAGSMLPALGESVAAQGNGYKDVPVSHDHYQNIMDANQNGFMTGYPDNTFKPNISLSRGNVVKALGKYVVKSSGKDLSQFNTSAVQPFNDVPKSIPDKELYTYSLIVKQAGIFTGSNNNLEPMKLITRQQMAKVLVNAFKLEKIAGVQSKVTDQDLAFGEFKPYIELLSVNGVTNVEEFRPVETTTRGQFASFLMRSHLVKSGGATNPKPDPNPVPDPNPQPDPNPEPDPNPQPDPEPDPNPQPDPEPDPEPVAVAVETLLPIVVIVGDAVQLPTTVKVTYDNNEVKTKKVNWIKPVNNFNTVGEYEVKGGVEGTTLEAKIHVSVFFKVILLDPEWVQLIKDTNQLINNLPAAVKNAKNSDEAHEKVGEALKAILEVEAYDNGYDTEAWYTVVFDQLGIAQKRQHDTAVALAAAKKAVDELPNKLKGVITVARAKSFAKDARDKVNRLRGLDQKYPLTSMNNILNAQDKRVNTLVELETVIKKVSYTISSPTSILPLFQLYTPKVSSDILESSEYVGSSAFDLSNKAAFLRRADVFGPTGKGKITMKYRKDNIHASRAYEITVPSMGFFSHSAATGKTFAYVLEMR